LLFLYFGKNQQFEENVYFVGRMVGTKNQRERILYILLVLVFGAKPMNIKYRAICWKNGNVAKPTEYEK